MKFKKLMAFLLCGIAAISCKAQKATSPDYVTGTLHHVGISVNNIKQMQAWYTTCFNLKEVQHLELEDMHVRTVLLEAGNGLRVELIELKGSKREHSFSDPLNACTVQGYGHIAIQVKDIRHVFELLLKKGGKEVVPPSPAAKKGDTYAYVKDIEGNLIELIESGN